MISSTDRQRVWRLIHEAQDQLVAAEAQAASIETGRDLGHGVSPDASKRLEDLEREVGKRLARAAGVLCPTLKEAAMNEYLRQTRGAPDPATHEALDD